MVLEKTLESSLDYKEIQTVHLKGDQSWIFIGRTDAEVKTPILWPPDVKNWLIWKDPDAGKDWRWDEKGMTEDEMVGWHHRLNGHEFQPASGVYGQGGLACFSPWGCKESDTTEWLNWTELNKDDADLQVQGSFIWDSEGEFLRLVRTTGDLRFFVIRDEAKLECRSSHRWLVTCFNYCNNSGRRSTSCLPGCMGYGLYVPKCI